MGCDIHLAVERRVDGRWEYVKPPPCPYPHSEDGYCSVSACWPIGGERTEFYGGRNYALFGVLARVRRDGPPIAECRGFPGDVTDPITRTFCEDVDHSASWLTVAEVLAHDWEKPCDGSLTATAGEACSDFLTIVRNEIANLGPPDSVRLVFFFDN